MKRATADLGKCTACGVAKVEWIDEAAGVMLCGRCYERERRGRKTGDDSPGGIK